MSIVKKPTKMLLAVKTVTSSDDLNWSGGSMQKGWIFIKYIRKNMVLSIVEDKGRELTLKITKSSHI